MSVLENLETLLTSRIHGKSRRLLCRRRLLPSSVPIQESTVGQVYFSKCGRQSLGECVENNILAAESPAV